jgi:hypothetical protein
MQEPNWEDDGIGHLPLVGFLGDHFTTPVHDAADIRDLLKCAYDFRARLNQAIALAERELAKREI